MNILCSIVLALHIIQSDVAHANNSASLVNKRLLLNDPDVTALRLSNAEKSIQDMIGLTQQLQTQNSNMQTTIAHLEATLVTETSKRLDLQTTISQLQTELTKETRKTSGMQLTLSQLQTELSQEKVKVSQALSHDQGSTFVRWGRKQCAGLNTDLVYTGFIAGQEHYKGSTYYGGPTNILCLPNNPELSNRTAPGNSVLAGSEYEDGNFFIRGAQNEDAPCALCRSRNTSSSVMIPGKVTCYDGWKMEYYGILASGAYGHRPSSYICIDSLPEFIQGGQDDKNGFLLYATSTKCGSLPCPPYGDNLAVNCVVCSK